MGGTKTAPVCGASGFVGDHMVIRLQAEAPRVRGVDLKLPDFSDTTADDFTLCGLPDPDSVPRVRNIPFDEVHRLAADMGGAGGIFTSTHDADVTHNSATINLNIPKRATQLGVQEALSSFSACVCPEHNQLDVKKPVTAGASAYPSAPCSEYGCEKLLSGRVYSSFHRNHGLNARIARFRNMFGPLDTWTGGRAKVPAAICRRVAEADDGGRSRFGETANRRDRFSVLKSVSRPLQG
jgi:nucleoside-diphosphate-sugar epimerase